MKIFNGFQANQVAIKFSDPFLLPPPPPPPPPPPIPPPPPPPAAKDKSKI